MSFLAPVDPEVHQLQLKELERQQLQELQQNLQSELDYYGQEIEGLQAQIAELEGDQPDNLEKYADQQSDHYCAMLEVIRKRLGLTSLRYQLLDDLVESIGLPKEQLCTFCWDGAE